MRGRDDGRLACRRSTPGRRAPPRGLRRVGRLQHSPPRAAFAAEKARQVRRHHRPLPAARRSLGASARVGRLDEADARQPAKPRVAASGAMPGQLHVAWPAQLRRTRGVGAVE